MSLPADYEALRSGVGVADFNSRTLVELAGDDRAKFLHNLCTNDIRKLAPFAGCEAFLTNVQGKTIGHVLVFSGPETLVLETVPGQAETIIRHLDRYLIRERVELRDRTTDWAEWLVSGPQSAAMVEGLCGQPAPATRLLSARCEIAGRETWVRRVDIAGPVGFLLECRRAEASAVFESLLAAGARQVGDEALAAARIEAGFPSFGLDISEKNLPQEIARDDRAISFTKGCYLGQETVARIDALGHVNRTLCGLQFEPASPELGGTTSLPTAGMELWADDQPGEHAAGEPASAPRPVAAEVTSVAWSPRTGGAVALAFVRRGSQAPGTWLQSAAGRAQVVRLPLV